MRSLCTHQFPPLRVTASACLLLLMTGLHAAQKRAAAEPPLRVREVYVPYKEFRELAGKNPDGIVMPLSQYRALVMRALGRIEKKQPEAVLPPVSAAVTDVRYSGMLIGDAVRFHAVCTVRSAVDAWTLCPVGALLPKIGSVVTDDAPGWIVVKKQMAFLLVKGKGTHRVSLFFTLGVEEVEDVTTITGPLLASPAARVELSVPGRVEAEASPGFLQVDVQPGENGAGTVSKLMLSCGRAPKFSIRWKQKKAPGEKDVYLEARNMINYIFTSKQGAFTWRADVTISRRKTDRIRFSEVQGGRLLRLHGPLVYSWERTADGHVSVLLKEACSGTITIEGSGVLDSFTDTVSLHVPHLAGAYADYGFLALYAASNTDLSPMSRSFAREASSEKAGVPQTVQLPHGAGVTASLCSVYSFTGSKAQVSVRLAPVPAVFEAAGSFLADVSETEVLTSGVLELSVLQGLRYRFTFFVPAPWEVVSCSELQPDAAKRHGTSCDMAADDEKTTVRVSVDKAVTPGEPFTLALFLVYRGFAENRSWERKELAVELPVVPEAVRNRFDCAVMIANSMDAMMEELPAWYSLSPGAIEQLGFHRVVRMRGNRKLAAALKTRQDEARMTLVVVHRPPRGEYCVVTHLLALERFLRVRSDIRFTCVDRPIEKLLFRLSPAAGPNAVVFGPGIKEITISEEGGTRTALFEKPWLGTRRFRVEYELSLDPGERVPVPLVGIDAGTGKSFFGSEQFVVLQSRGPVEIEPPSGEGLRVIDMADLPDFAVSWKQGRLLRAYRVKDKSAAGTICINVHPRAPVVSRLARSMKLITLISESGVSRTQAELLLAYGRDQSVTMVLPPDARCLAVTVNDEPEQAVILPEEKAAGGGAGENVIAVPLPPQSYATVRITYERGNGTEEGAAGAVEARGALGNFGTWSEPAPKLPGISVGRTTWTVVRPRGYLFSVRHASSFQPVDFSCRETGSLFADTFFRRIFSGRFPLFTTFEGKKYYGKQAQLPPLTSQEMQGAEKKTQQVQRLAAQRQGRTPEARHAAAPFYTMLPEGIEIETEKLGGGGALELTYASDRWRQASRAGVFWGVLLIGLLCFTSMQRSRFWMFFVSVLVLGACLPFVIQVASPLFLHPLCEGIVVLLSAAAVFSLLRLLLRPLFRAWSRKKRLGVPQAGGPLALVIAFLFTGGLAAASQAGDALPASLSPDDVVISYNPETMSWEDPDGADVYMPYSKFLDLWRFAYPDEEKKRTEAPVAVVLGAAEYHAEVHNVTCRVTGQVQVNVLTDKWVTLPLPCDRSQLSAVRIDGVEAGVFQKDPSAKRGLSAVPFIKLKGEGVKTIELAFVASVTQTLGEYRVRLALMSGACATLCADLPEGAVAQAFRRETRQRRGARQEFPAVVETGKGKTALLVDLGGADWIALKWSFPLLDARSGSRVASVSYTRLDLAPGGCTVKRHEKLQVTGRKVDHVTYRVEGAWEITSIEGPHLSEWNISDDGAGAGSLKLFFTQPVSAAALRMTGRLSLEEMKAPLAFLTLLGAVKQETFVGIHHGSERRFAADVLGGMDRVSKNSLLQAMQVPSFTLPDRLYHTYGSGAGEMLRVETVKTSVNLETDLVFVLESDRFVVTGRTRYRVKGTGPLHHEVAVPESMTVRSVQCALLRDWEVVERDGGRRLVIDFQKRAGNDTSLVWTMERKLSKVPAALKIPVFRAGVSGDATIDEALRLLFAANDEFTLRAEDNAGWISIAPERISSWITLPESVSYRFAFRSSRSEELSTIDLAVTPRTSRTSGDVVSFVRVAESFLHVNARIIYRVRMGGCRKFSFLLPAGSELVSLETRNQQSREVKRTEKGTEVSIVLQTKAMDSHAVDVAYRVARSDAERMPVASLALLPAESGLDDVRQYVGVVQTRMTLISVLEKEGLFDVEAEQFPFLPEGVSVGSLRPTYKAAGGSWRLVLGEEKIRIVEGPEAVIALAELTTRIERDGTNRTEVTYTLNNRALQFLVLSLPPEAVLWGVTLNGASVSVGRGGNNLLRIPLEYVGEASMDLTVALKYEEPDLPLPAFREKFALAAPKVRDVKIMETVWNLYFPDGYALSVAGKNIREIPSSTRVAKKVGNLLDQYKKISKAVQAADSIREQEKGRRAMAQLEQVLSDNVVQLRETNRSAAEQAKVDRIGRQELESQWLGNSRLIDESEQVQKQLRDTLKAEERKQAQQQAENRSRGRQEQALIDKDNFLRQSWRGGKKVREPGLKGRKTPVKTKGFTLGTLTGDSPVGNYERFSALFAPEQGIENARAETLDARKGLKPVAESLDAQAPGFETAPPTVETVPYVFLRSGGDAPVQVTLTRRKAAWRLAALIVLVLVPAFILWLLRKEVKSKGTDRGF